MTATCKTNDRSTIRQIDRGMAGRLGRGMTRQFIRFQTQAVAGRLSVLARSAKPLTTKVTKVREGKIRGHKLCDTSCSSSPIVGWAAVERERPDPGRPDALLCAGC